MPFLQEMGITGKVIIVFVALLIGVAVSFLVYYKRYQKEDREKEQYAMRRMREEALDRALANPMQKDEAKPFEKQRRPFQVEYSKGDDGHKTKGQDRMFQITEITELSQRKYMFRCREQVSIGNQFGTVMILPGASDQEQIYCQVFFYEGANYVRSTGRQQIVLKRKGQQAIVNQNGIKLQSKDTFTVGLTAFQVDFL